MANNKSISRLMLVAGVIILIVSLGADRLGFGTGGRFGAQQILGTAAAILLIVVGFLYSRR